MDPAEEVVVGHSCAHGVPAGTGSQESLGLGQLLSAEVTSKGKKMDLGLSSLVDIKIFTFCFLLTYSEPLVLIVREGAFLSHCWISSLSS